MWRIWWEAVLLVPAPLRDGVRRSGRPSSTAHAVLEAHALTTLASTRALGEWPPHLESRYLPAAARTQSVQVVGLAESRGCQGGKAPPAFGLGGARTAAPDNRSGNPRCFIHYG